MQKESQFCYHTLALFKGSRSNEWHLNDYFLARHSEGELGLCSKEESDRLEICAAETDDETNNAKLEILVWSSYIYKLKVILNTE